MGVFDSIGKELKRFGRSAEKEIIRNPIFTGGLGKMYLETMREQKLAQKEMIAQQKAVQRERVRQLTTRRAEQSRQQRLLLAEQAKQRRISMAETIVGQEFGMFDSSTVEGPNMAVNKIPVLDDVDDMGNLIPEV